MLITLRLPKAAADRLNLRSGTSAEEVTVTLTTVELAGRLTLLTGKAIAPEAVARYCSAWQAAMAASRALANNHGADRLTEMLRAGCRERRLWVPDRDEDVLLWLQCVLLVHFLSSRSVDTARPDEVLDWACPQSAESLTGLCQTNFPAAYQMWVEGEATGDRLNERWPRAGPETASLLPS